MPVSFTTLQAGQRGVLYGADAQASPTWVGYYLPLAAAGGTPPPTLTLESSWTDYWGNPLKQVNGGCYVFLAEQPPAATADALDALLTSLNAGFQGRAYRYLLWCPKPDTGKPLAAAGAVPFAPKSTGSRQGAVFGGGTLTIGSLQLAVPSGIVLQPGDDDASIAASTAGAARFALSQTRGVPSGVGAIAGGATIPLAGVTSGGLSLGIDLTVYSKAVNNDFATLCTGVKYFYEHGGIVKSQLSPILGVPSGNATMPFAAILDPLHPFDETYTRLTFSAGSPFSTSLVTTTGIPLTLDPVVGDAGLALAGDRVTPVGGGAQVVSSYAVLSGAYTIGPGAPCPAGPLPLLCGMSGLEAVSVTPTGGGYPGDKLRFHVGQPAFAPGFPPVKATLNDPSGAGLDHPPLDTTLTTAYASVEPATGGSAAQYFAQPHGAPLFGGGSALGLLPLLEQPLGAATAPFPLAAYGGAAPEPVPDGFDPAQLPAFEQAVLSPVRRGALVGGKQAKVAAEAAAGDDGGTKATTPQGFVVTLGAGTSWASLVLAQTTSQGSTSKLEFANPVDPRVQAAFQTNQLALVATQRAWDRSTFANDIAIEGWPFHVAIGEDQAFGSYSNVMIAKFCHGKLTELVADPKRWTDASTFNATADSELVAVSQWVQSYVHDAVHSTAPEFAHFKAIATSDDWQGILLLKVDVPLDDLPPQVGALRAGLSQSTFYAHHLGIEVSKVDASISVDGSSSLFGLIDYADPVYAAALAAGAPPQTPIPPTPGLTYDFKVLRMLVVFENSEVKEFQSTSQVTLNQWFGDAVLTARMGDGESITNSIVIDGALQRHDGQPVYTFASAVDSIFDLDSNVLPSVEVLTTTLTTIVDSPTGLSTFRFAFSGNLAFAALPGLDAFSFGPADPKGGGGLAFTDLFLDMGFEPSAAVPRTFTFDPGKIAFDAALSTPRPASMYAALPLTLKGLVVGGAGGPSKLGYLDVSVPDVKRSSLPDAWYGLQLDLDLGTPGALAAEIGWTASLLLAWGPGSGKAATTARAAVGLHLPGAGGQSKLLSLQGVLKLTIGDLQLRCVAGGAYMLTLRSIALHFLAVQFPPSGSTAFYLFGKPGATPGERSPLAWYGAYAAAQKKKALAP